MRARRVGSLGTYPDAEAVVPSPAPYWAACILVLRFCGRAWEWWVLGEDQPAELDEMVRLICRREPEADTVAIALVAVLPDMPDPGIQILAEHPTGRAEHFAVFDFPEGARWPSGISRILQRDLPQPAEGSGWLGIEPMLLFDLTPIEPVDTET